MTATLELDLPLAGLELTLTTPKARGSRGPRGPRAGSLEAPQGMGQQEWMELVALWETEQRQSPTGRLEEPLGSLPTTGSRTVGEAFVDHAPAGLTVRGPGGGEQLKLPRARMNAAVTAWRAADPAAAARRDHDSAVNRYARYWASCAEHCRHHLAENPLKMPEGDPKGGPFQWGTLAHERSELAMYERYEKLAAAEAEAALEREQAALAAPPPPTVPQLTFDADLLGLAS